MLDVRQTFITFKESYLTIHDFRSLFSAIILLAYVSCQCLLFIVETQAQN